MSKPKKAPQELAQIEKKQKRQQRLLNNMEKREQWMKWLIIGLLILLLLLILFFGYATDWTKGLRKDSSVDTPTNRTSASADQGGDAAGATEKTTTGTGTTSTGTNNNTGRTTTNTGTTNTGTNTNSTAKETSNTSTTTTNNNTTNTVTPAPSSGGGLLNLYADTSIGDNISEAIDALPGLVGVSKNCRNEILIQVCDFTEGNLSVTTRNLLGTGIITSITKNF